VADLPPIRSQDPDAFLDESQERLRYALRGLLSRSSGRALCPLSSGYDSRRLLLEGHAGGAALSTVTGVEFEPRGGRLVSLEPAVAGELCRRLGFPNRQVLTPGYSPMSPATARFVRNSFLDFQVIDHAHCWAMPMVGATSRAGALAVPGESGATSATPPLPADLRALTISSKDERPSTAMPSANSARAAATAAASSGGTASRADRGPSTPSMPANRSTVSPSTCTRGRSSGWSAATARARPR